MYGSDKDGGWWCGGGGGSPCEIQAIKSNIGIETVQLDDGPIEQLANLN